MSAALRVHLPAILHSANSGLARGVEWAPSCRAGAKGGGTPDPEFRTRASSEPPPIAQKSRAPSAEESALPVPSSGAGVPPAQSLVENPLPGSGRSCLAAPPQIPAACCFYVATAPHFCLRHPSCKAEVGAAPSAGAPVVADDFAQILGQE